PALGHLEIVGQPADGHALHADARGEGQRVGKDRVPRALALPCTGPLESAAPGRHGWHGSNNSTTVRTCQVAQRDWKAMAPNNPSARAWVSLVSIESASAGGFGGAEPKIFR